MELAPMIGVGVSDFQHAVRGNQGFTSRLLATLFTPLTLLVISVDEAPGGAKHPHNCVMLVIW